MTSTVCEFLQGLKPNETKHLRGRLKLPPPKKYLRHKSCHKESSRLMLGQR
jgi:hypothetical protein